MRNIVAKIQSSRFYSIFCDETTDTSNIEQAVITIRWVQGMTYVGSYHLSMTMTSTVKVSMNMTSHGRILELYRKF